MSGSPVLSAKLPSGVAESVAPNIAVPRPARQEDAPVRSPVHQLQEELMAGRFGQAEGDSPTESASGWVRLGLPLALSVLLWTVIFGFIEIISGPFVP
ncbi:hypothetical protein [Novosphingobium sp. CCH12-A3]|jgi:hypothetical protein|uniref:hypothetical protein n=1 Tax=Novosphingobium sp. CCH12-A3 TaxID=1768752 RepID=UPI000ADA893F|nr:hypothetical protein [Novosphingobium sp. CCH12-A3]